MRQQTVAASTRAPPAARSSIELIGIRTAALRAGIEHMDKRYRSARHWQISHRYGTPKCGGPDFLARLVTAHGDTDSGLEP